MENDKWWMDRISGMKKLPPKFRKAKAEFEWIVQRRWPGFGYPQCCESYFEGKSTEGESWSLFSFTDGKANSESKNHGVVCFRVESAPQEWLEVGNRFSICEGSHVMAKGVIEKILNDEEWMELLGEYEKAWN